MKKDLFNGNIKSEHVRSIKISLFFGTLILIIGGTILVLIGILYKNIDSNLGRILTCVFGGICYLFSILLPLSSILLIRKYPKHKNIAHLFIKESYFTDFTEQ